MPFMTTGAHHTPETRKKLRALALARNQSGSKNPNWRGGKKPNNKTAKCVDCGNPCTRRRPRCKNCYFKRLSKLLKGRKHSAEHVRKRAESIKGDKHWNWKGDAVKLPQLHAWIKLRLPKPEFCDKCKKVPPYDLANKGTYNRDLKNWEWLCRKCHMLSDGRLDRFVNVHNAHKMRRARALLQMSKGNRK